jgi:signal transduction histidine kinase/CheY-like chemotaxis protein
MMNDICRKREAQSARPHEFNCNGERFGVEFGTHATIMAIRSFVRLMLRRIGGLASSLALLCAWPVAAHAQLIELREAQRATPAGTVAVSLPDTLRAAPGDAPPLRATYRMSFEQAVASQPLSLCMPGLIAHARLKLNGHVIDDRLADPLAPLPRSANRIRLIDIPQEFVLAGTNRLEIEAAGRTFISISPVNLGPRAALGARYEKRMLGAVIGPAFVAVAVGSLALCVLLLWARTGDALYGFFGLGSFGWALHDAWSVVPFAPLTGVHNVVWWTSLYGFFVAMLVVFCVRFAGWRWPRFDRTLIVLAVCAPLSLYAANGADILEPVQEAWLLAWIAVVAVGLAGVTHYAWTHRNTDGALLLLTGAVSMIFAVRDWWINHRADDNNPVYLVPYAGLLFVILVAWMLIDRFVAASRELEALNAGLEQRVSAKSAQLLEALARMSESKAIAEAANRAKTTFLAAASHDLRQPIHALALYMAALVDDRLSVVQRDIVQRMKASLGALDTMFNALLDVSRMEAGAVIPRPRPFGPAPMLHRIAEEFAPLALQKGLRLSVRIAPAPPGMHAMSDPMLVERVVRNLLSNAVKHTPSGGVLLSCRWRSRPEGHWRIEVWDTGPGIDHAEQERVFDEFYQVGNPERDRAGGLGLGLSIVRRLTDILGHRLDLCSRLGRGTRFGLELPGTSDTPPILSADGADGSIEGLGVAVVDDDPDVRHSMRVLLARWGCRAYCGADAKEVLRRAGANPGSVLQVIVADYRLRENRTGVDAIEALRAACARELPALIVSGDSSPQRIAQMQSSGFEFMSKPVKPANLRSWLGDAAPAAPLAPNRKHNAAEGLR